jgi:para-nitrobenzyl esterase
VFGCAEAPRDPEISVAQMALEAAGSSAEPDSTVVGEVENSAIVLTRQGLLQGILTNTGTRMFLGVPYAQPPVGALRFRPPQPVMAWSGTRIADTFGPACVQPRGALSAQGPQSEDCLSLNVYAANRANRSAPVMVFIHGGAFVTGGSSQFDGQKLAEAGQVIVVTINYRLGALGLLSLPELDAERAGTPSGNDAFRDQQLALTWVRDNIASFGGDPANVTVFGEHGASATSALRTHLGSRVDHEGLPPPRWTLSYI